MKISDELIACYVEGTVTTEERKIVREYLCKHPEEYDRVLCLMDNDTVDYMGEQLEVYDDCIPMSEASFSDIAYSAAAFAPEQNSLYLPKREYRQSKVAGLYGTLCKVSEELDEL